MQSKSDGGIFVFIKRKLQVCGDARNTVLP